MTYWHSYYILFISYLMRLSTILRPIPICHSQTHSVLLSRRQHQKASCPHSHMYPSIKESVHRSICLKFSVGAQLSDQGSRSGDRSKSNGVFQINVPTYIFLLASSVLYVVDINSTGSYSFARSSYSSNFFFIRFKFLLMT